MKNISYLVIYFPSFLLIFETTNASFFYRMERKYKLKKYQRPSERMEWEVTGMWNGEKLLNPGDRRKTPQRKRGPQKKRRF